jgi:hypothetical protein
MIWGRIHTRLGAVKPAGRWTWQVIFITALAVPAHAGTWYVATTGKDTNDCLSAASACRTVNAAYQKAKASDSIQVAGGSYGAESIVFRSGTSAPGVTIQPAGGSTPVFTDVNIRASNLTWVGPMTMRTLDLGDVNLGNRTQNVVVDGVTVDHQNSSSPDWRAMKVWATDNVTFKNSAIGNTLSGASVGEDSNLIQFSGGTYSTNFTVDNVRFHHNDTPANSAAHNECIYAINIQGFTVRNSRFESCTYYGIFFTDFLNGQPHLKNVTIENNAFSQGKNSSGASYPYAIDMHANVAPDNFKFRYNTFEAWVALSYGGASINGFEVKGNIFGLGIVADSAVGTFACKSGVAFSYNVMPQGCGTTSTVATSAAIRSGWAAPSATWGVADDFHLVATSPAVGKGDPASFPATDIIGNARAALGIPDAGAYEYVSTSTKPNPPTNLAVTVQ